MRAPTLRTALGFDSFSPFTRPHVVEIAEGIPFIELTGYDHERLYALKGEIIRRGMKQTVGIDFPVFPKRRFQHGAIPVEQLRRIVPDREQFFRRKLAEVYLDTAR